MPLDRIDALVSQKSALWKFWNSLWILVVGIGFGVLSVLGWLWAGAKARSTKVWCSVAVWTLVTAVFIFSLRKYGQNKDSVWNTISSILFLVSWFGSLIHASIMRNSVLRGVAAREEQAAQLRAQYGMTTPQTQQTQSDWSPPAKAPTPTSAPPGAPLPQALQVDMGQYYGQPAGTGSWAPASSAPARPTAQPAPAAPPRSAPSSSPAQRPPQPAEQRPPAMSSPPASSSPTTPVSAPVSGPVDINTAPAENLLALPALGQADVERIVAARGERGGFRDMDDLVSAASLQPHQLVALQDRVVFGEFTRPGSQGHGRVLDL